MRNESLVNPVTVLRTWASMGSEMLSRRPSKAADWKVFDRLIEVAREKLVGDAKLLRTLLVESRKLLAPLQDPFDVDLGLHRWLCEDREEAYSDWLEWVIQQTTNPRQVFDLLNLPDPPHEVVECSQRDIRRECCVPHGHEDQAGRLDLVVRFGSTAIIVIEVKKDDADAADTEKHGGYSRWLVEQNYPEKCKHCVLIALSAEEMSYGGFGFVPWSSLCIAMRRLAVDFIRDKRMTTAAMILAFVAAIEQNLLGYSAAQVRDICEGCAVLFNPSVVNYLERIVESLGGINATYW